LQEEELESSKKKFSPKETSKHAFKPYIAGDKARQAEPDKAKAKLADDKLSSLKTYRRQNGLCFRCGEKWGPGHKCPAQVSIHVVEELLDAREDCDDLETATAEESIETEGVMAIGDKIVPLNTKRKTMKLSGYIGDMQVLILVDSGSVGSFVSSAVADKLQAQLQGCRPAQYITADGSPMTCS
jgi:hypothetical protein